MDELQELNACGKEEDGDVEGLLKMGQESVDAEGEEETIQHQQQQMLSVREKPKIRFAVATKEGRSIRWGFMQLGNYIARFSSSSIAFSLLLSLLSIGILHIELQDSIRDGYAPR